jgi:hypothetical protein
MKTCNTCGCEKEDTEFYLHRGGRTKEGYRAPTCKPCHAEKSKTWAKNNPDKVKAHRRKRNLKTKYNITVEEYDKMFEEQQGKCFICSSVADRRRLNVDHCHDTGKVRKLLCDKCNMALGLLEDDIDRIQKVREYLENFTDRHRNVTTDGIYLGSLAAKHRNQKHH